MFISKPLRLNNLKTKTAMNTKISVFVICVEEIIYLLLYNLYDCTFNLFDNQFLKSIENYMQNDSIILPNTPTSNDNRRPVQEV